jgi:hypothetical protein
LLELKLLESRTGEEATSFWADLKSADKKINDAALKKIGDAAEGWSLLFEVERLNSIGLAELAERIAWISRDSDLHGYDILSFSGEPFNPNERRHIEVKRAKVVRPGFVSFYLSRNEFDRAVEFADRYLFHIWWKDGAVNRMNLSVLPSKDVVTIAPQDGVLGGRWTESVIEVDLARAAPWLQRPDIAG